MLGGELARHDLPRLRIAQRRCSLPGACAARDLAYATRGRRPCVTLLARALRLPRANVLGLLRHELGHVYDLDPRAPGCEQRADDTAEWVRGEPIRYDRNLIQTVGAGTYPRPKGLHR